MAKLSGREIQTLAKQIIAENPGGIRYGALVHRISLEHPETPQNTIHGSVWNLAARFPSEVTKPSRGLFLPAAAAGVSRAGPQSSLGLTPRPAALSNRPHRVRTRKRTGPTRGPAAPTPGGRQCQPKSG